MSLLILIFLINVTEVKPLADSDSLGFVNTSEESSDAIEYSYGMDTYTVGFNKNSISTNTVEENIDVSSGQLSLNIKLASLPMRGNKDYKVYLTYRGSPISASAIDDGYSYYGYGEIRCIVDEDECLITSNMGNCGLGWNIMPGEFFYGNTETSLASSPGGFYKGSINLNGGFGGSAFTRDSKKGSWLIIDKPDWHLSVHSDDYVGGTGRYHVGATGYKDLIYEGPDLPYWDNGDTIPYAELITPEHKYHFESFARFSAGCISCDTCHGEDDPAYFDPGQHACFLTKMFDNNGNYVDIEWHGRLESSPSITPRRRIPAGISTPTDSCRFEMDSIPTDTGALREDWDFYYISKLEEPENSYEVRFYYTRKYLPQAIEFYYGHEAILLDSIKFYEDGEDIKPPYKFYYDYNTGELIQFITPDGAEYNYEYESVEGFVSGHGRTEYRRIKRKEVVLPETSDTLVYEYHYEGGTDLEIGSVGEKWNWGCIPYSYYPMYKKSTVVMPENDSIVYWHIDDTYRTDRLEWYFIEGGNTYSETIFPENVESFYGKPYKIVNYDHDGRKLKLERLYWAICTEKAPLIYSQYLLSPVLRYKITQKDPDDTVIESDDENLNLYEYTKYDGYGNKKEYKFLGEVSGVTTAPDTVEYDWGYIDKWIDNQGKLQYNDEDPEDSWIVEQGFKHEEDSVYIRETGSCGSGCVWVRYYQLVHLLTSKERSTINESLIERIEFEYDGNSLTSLSGEVDFSHFDGDNYGSDFTIRGNLTQKTEWITEDSTRSQEYWYSLCGHLIELNDYLGESYNFLYGVSTVFPHLKRYPDNSVEQFRFNNEGDLIRFIDKNNVSRYFDYDCFGRLTSDSIGDDLLNEYKYDDFDRIAEAISFSSDISSDTIIYYYDNLGRLEKEEACGEGADGDVIKDFYYDGNGRLFEETVPRFINDPVYSVIKDFDCLSRVTEIEYPSDGEDEYVEYFYDGDTTVVYDEEGDSTKLINDASGNLITVQDALGNYTYYEYDVNGNLLSIEDAEEKFTDFEYNWLGNLVRREGPDRGIDIFEYDANGNTKYHKSNSGDEIEFEYDELNRIETKRVNNQIKETYFYDSYDNVGGDTYDPPDSLEYPEGRLTGFENSNVKEVYFYDKFGNLAEKLIFLSTGYVDTIEYSYDLKGRLTELQYPGGYKVKYDYDHFDNISSVEINDGETVDFSSTAVGLLSTVDFPVGVTDAFTYKPRNWMESLHIEGVPDPDDENYKEFIYNKRGELTEVQWGDPLTTYIYYQYDALGRLVHEHRYDTITNHDFTYDKVGNRDSVNGNAYAYETGTNMLIDDGQNTYDYNYIGCIKSKISDLNDTTNFSYDAEGRLAGVVLPGGEYGYKYYYKGYQRIREEKLEVEVISTTTERFVYSCNVKSDDLTGGILEAVFLNEYNDEVGTHFLQNIPDTDLSWLTLSGFIPEEDFPSETFTIKLRVKRESGSTGSLWVGDMNVDIEEIEGEGDIDGTVVQANDYFYDNAGNLILVNSVGSGTAANVVQNPGFETGDLSGWSVCGGYGGGVSDDFDEYEGEYSLVFSGNGSVCQEIFLSETVSSPITISCWVEISCFWGEGEFELKGVLKGDGINEEHSTEIIAESCDWTQVSVTIDSIPEGTSSCEIKLIKVSGFGYVFVDNVAFELETEQEINTKYIYAGSRLLAKEKNGELFFYHLDRIGSPIMITDESGAVVKEKKYEAFGNLVWAEGDYEDNREFTSKEKDPTGFHYFGARYYYGDIGRFLTPDPHTLMPGNIDLSNPQSINPYVYCVNNPTKYIDPLGLDWYDMGTADKPNIQWREGSDPQLKPGFWNRIASFFGGGEYAETLGEEVLVAYGSLDEDVNEAKFEYYSSRNRTGPTATGVGNTVPSDRSKYATIAEGTHDATLERRGGHLAFRLSNDGSAAIPTTSPNPNPESNYYRRNFADGVLIHIGNTGRPSMFTWSGDPISTACQTMFHGDPASYDAFMSSFGPTWTGKYYLTR